jgi:hypothetical protein
MAGRTNKQNYQQIVCADVSGNNELQFCLTLMDKLPCLVANAPVKKVGANKYPTDYAGCISSSGV